MSYYKIDNILTCNLISKVKGVLTWPANVKRTKLYIAPEKAFLATIPVVSAIFLFKGNITHKRGMYWISIMAATK